MWRERAAPGKASGKAPGAPAVRPRLVRWAVYSVGLNVALIVAHGAVAIGSGSLAVAAELVHNMVDLVAAVAVVIGVRLANRVSKGFPYGLHKVESVVAVGMAGLIFVTAFQIARRALLGSLPTPETSGWMLGLVAVTTVAPLVFSRFELRVAKAERSMALAADAREYRAHVATTGLVFVALASEGLGWPVDRIAAAGIVVVIVRTGWDVLVGGMRVLLDASLDPATLARIEATIRADPAVRGIRWLTARNAGRFCFVEAGVDIRATVPADVVVARIERAVESAVADVDRVLVHPEAPQSDRVRVAFPMDAADRLSAHFGDN